jgi:hypothetical protein
MKIRLASWYVLLCLDDACAAAGRLATVKRGPCTPSGAGQSRTLLPNGRWLLAGGQGVQGPLATAAIFDPQTNSLTPVAQPLLQPRAWHTATVLADGSVLIAGGVGPGGQVSTVLEHFDPTMQAFHLVPATGLVPRADQTATLLTDGRVLFAGGVSPQGQVLGDAQLFNPQTYAVDAVQPLSTARRGATATSSPTDACCSGAARMPPAQRSARAMSSILSRTGSLVSRCAPQPPIRATARSSWPRSHWSAA